MKRLLLGFIGTLVATAVHAACPSSLLLKDANGVTAPAKYTDDGSGNCQVNTATQDGADATLGAKADAAWVSGSGSSIAIGKAIAGNTSSAVPAGANTIGSVSIVGATSTGATSLHLLSGPSTNSTSVKTTPGTVYSVTVIQTTTTPGDFRFYNTAGAPTCSSAAGVLANYALQSNATSPGFSLNFGDVGMAFSTGIGFCLTGAVSDSDSTSFVSGAQVNILYK